eukprot:g6512.t1
MATQLYGHTWADAAVFIANFFMFGFGLECLFRGYVADEDCDFPLYTFLLVQLALVALLQFAIPITKFVSSGSTTSQSPSVLGTLFLLQLIWIFLGLMWYTSDSDCASSAPYLTYGCKWLVLVYGAVVPIEFFWWMLYICKEKKDSDVIKKVAV